MFVWETGTRLGAANCLDVGDLNPEGKRIGLVHRPDRGTWLKNAGEGERPVALSENLASMLQDHVENGRHDISDEHGREPLFTTTPRRMLRTAIRGTVYRVTAPCFRGNPFPNCTETVTGRIPKPLAPMLSDEDTSRTADIASTPVRFLAPSVSPVRAPHY